MTERDINFFTNEYYQLLQIIAKEEHSFQNKRYSPVLHEELALTMNCSRQTIGKMIKTLISNGYVKQLMKGRIQITSKGKDILKKINSEE